MWVAPLLGTIVSGAFAVALGRRFVTGWRPAVGVWALALLAYAGASFALTLGAAVGWSATTYRWFWFLGAVLTVPFLAGGEVLLLVRAEWVRIAVLLGLVFLCAYGFGRIRVAEVEPAALTTDLPRGSEVFAVDPGVLRLARVASTAGYVLLLLGTGWSAWSMRGDPARRARSVGTAAIAVGATIVAAGSAFAATGNLAGFSAMNTLGVGVMFWGFLRASRRAPAPAGPAASRAAS